VQKVLNRWRNATLLATCAAPYLILTILSIEAALAESATFES